jgi:hypothetical protein
VSTTSGPREADDYYELLQLVTAERLGSYLRASGGRVADAFALYEWNTRASSSVIELASMVEVLSRNALDRELTLWAHDRHDGASWFDEAPLDGRGCSDLRNARERATRQGRRTEVHGRVIAELSLGFWRFLVESRYLTSLWVPATHAAFPVGAIDLRTRQREVAFRMQQLTFVRNRAAHHEPIHARDLLKDHASALDLARWISPAAGAWVEAVTSLPAIVSTKP